MAEPSWEGDDDVQAQQRVKPPSALQQKIRTASFGQYTNDSSRPGMIYAPDKFNQTTGEFIGDRTPTNFNVQSGGQARVDAAYRAAGGYKREAEIAAEREARGIYAEGKVKGSTSRAQAEAEQARLQAIENKRQETERGGTQAELDLKAFAKKGGTRGIYAKFLSGQMDQASMMRAMGQEVASIRAGAGLAHDSADLYRMVSQEIGKLNKVFSGMVSPDKLIQTVETGFKEGGTAGAAGTGAYIPSFDFQKGYGTYTAPKQEERVGPYSFPEIPKYLQGKGWEEIDKWENWKKDPKVVAGIQSGTIIPGLWDPSGKDPKYGGIAEVAAQRKQPPRGPNESWADYSARVDPDRPGTQQNIDDYGNVIPDAGTFGSSTPPEGARYSDVQGLEREAERRRLAADQRQAEADMREGEEVYSVPGTGMDFYQKAWQQQQEEERRQREAYGKFSGVGGGGAGDQYTPTRDTGFQDTGDVDVGAGPIDKTGWTTNTWGGGITPTASAAPAGAPPNQGGGWNPFATSTAYAQSPGGSTPGQMPYWLNQMPDGSGIDNEGYIYKWKPDLGQWARTGAMAGGPAQQPPVQQPPGQQPPPGQGLSWPGWLPDPRDRDPQRYQWPPGVVGPATAVGRFIAPWPIRPDEYKEPSFPYTGGPTGDWNRVYGGWEGAPEEAAGAAGQDPATDMSGIAGMSFGGNASSVRDQIAQLDKNDPEAGMKAQALQKIMLAYSAQESFEERERQGNVSAKDIAEINNTSREAIAAIDYSIAMKDVEFTNQLKTFQQQESERQAQFQRDLAQAQTTGKWPDKGATLAQQQLTADTARLKEEQEQQRLRLGIQQTAATTAQTQADTEQSRWNATVKEAQQKMSGYMDTLRQNRTLEGQKFDALRAQQEAERTGLFDGPNGPQETLASRQMSIQENAQTMQREATMGLQALQKTSMLQETERMQIQSDKDEAINTANIAAARKNHVDLINLEKLKLENQKEMTKWTFIQDYISDPVKHLVAARTGLIGVIEQMLDIDFGLPELPMMDGSDLGLPTEQLLAGLSPTDRRLAMTEASLRNSMTPEGVQWGMGQQAPGTIMPGYSWGGTGGAR